jgi:hypothetical protein
MSSETPNKNKQKQRVNLLIQNSLLITDDKKEGLIARIDSFSGFQLEVLAEKLEGEAEVITQGLKDTIHELGKRGDQEGLKKYKKIKKVLSKGKRQLDEKISTREEEEHLADLENQINEL